MVLITAPRVVPLVLLIFGACWHVAQAALSLPATAADAVCTQPAGKIVSVASAFVLFADEAAGGGGSLRRMDDQLAGRLQVLATELAREWPAARVLVGAGAPPGVRAGTGALLSVAGGSSDPVVAAKQASRLRELAVAVGMDWVAGDGTPLGVCCQPSNTYYPECIPDQHTGRCADQWTFAVTILVGGGIFRKTAERCVGLWLGANHFISSPCGAVRSMVKPSAYRILAGDAEYVVEKVDSQAGAGGAVFSVYHTTQSPTVSANLMPIVMASSDPADALDVTTAAILGNTCDKCGNTIGDLRATAVSILPNAELIAAGIWITGLTRSSMGFRSDYKSQQGLELPSLLLARSRGGDWRLLGISTQQPRGGQNALVQTNIGLYADVRPTVVALMSTTGLLVLPPVLPLIAGLAQPQRSTACVLVPATNNARKLELVYLADMSGSMGDDLLLLRQTITDISSKIRAQFGGARIGLASYIDKPCCGFGRSSDYEFRVDVRLTEDLSALQTGINTLRASGGGDGPEAQLSALFYGARRLDEVGWSTSGGAQRVVVLMTDAVYHRASDFSGKPNNGDANAEVDEAYPSVGQVARALFEGGIIPIFAVTSNVVSAYQTLVAELGTGTVQVLASNSANLFLALSNSLQAVDKQVDPRVLGDAAGLFRAVTPSRLRLPLDTGALVRCFALSVASPVSPADVATGMRLDLPGFGNVPIVGMQPAASVARPPQPVRLEVGRIGVELTTDRLDAIVALLNTGFLASGLGSVAITPRPIFSSQGDGNVVISQSAADTQAGAAFIGVVTGLIQSHCTGLADLCVVFVRSVIISGAASKYLALAAAKPVLLIAADPASVSDGGIADRVFVAAFPYICAGSSAAGCSLPVQPPSGDPPPSGCTSDTDMLAWPMAGAGSAAAAQCQVESMRTVWADGLSTGVNLDLVQGALVSTDATNDVLLGVVYLASGSLPRGTRVLITVIFAFDADENENTGSNVGGLRGADIVVTAKLEGVYPYVGDSGTITMIVQRGDGSTVVPPLFPPGSVSAVQLCDTAVLDRLTLTLQASLLGMRRAADCGLSPFKYAVSVTANGFTAQNPVLPPSAVTLRRLGVSLEGSSTAAPGAVLVCFFPKPVVGLEILLILDGVQTLGRYTPAADTPLSLRFTLPQTVGPGGHTITVRASASGYADTVLAIVVDVCLDKACRLTDGTCFGAGDVSPANPCLVCDPSRNVLALSIRDNCNVHSPKPSQLAYTFEVGETDQPGTIIGYVAFQDDDAKSFTFSGSQQLRFRESSTPGTFEVILNSALPSHSDGSTLSLAFAVADTGFVPQLSTNFKVNIQVVDSAAGPRFGLVCSATGDPHYISFDSTRFDFYNTGEFWLLNTPALSVQTRLKVLGRASGNTAIALTGEVLGGAVLAVYGRAGSLDVRLDRLAVPVDGFRVYAVKPVAHVELASQPPSPSLDGIPFVFISAGLPGGSFTLRHSHERYEVLLDGFSNGYLNVHVTVPIGVPLPEGWGGLCGSARGLPPPASHTDNRMRVPEHASLFEYFGTDVSYATVNGPPPTGYEPQDDCSTDAKLAADAQAICATAQDMAPECVKDVCATGDIAASAMVISGFNSRAQQLMSATIVQTPPGRSSGEGGGNVKPTNAAAGDPGSTQGSASGGTASGGSNPNAQGSHNGPGGVLPPAALPIIIATCVLVVVAVGAAVWAQRSPTSAAITPVASGGTHYNNPAYEQGLAPSNTAEYIDIVQ